MYPGCEGSKRRARRLRSRRIGQRGSAAQENGLDHGCVLSRKGGHITKQLSNQIIRRLPGKAGLERILHADVFRHGCVINFLSCGWTLGCTP